MTTYRPSDGAEAAAVIAEAAARQAPLEIVGGGSKRALGRPMKTEHALDASRLSGIVAYEAAELVLTARAATPLATIKAELKAHRQMLAFEPPEWRGLLKSNAEPTLGGVLACNLAGPVAFGPGRRATISWASRRSTASARSGKPAEKWSRTSPATT